MVFSNPSPVVSDTESAPLTPEQVHFANLKSAELDSQLGLSPEKDLTDEEINEDQCEDEESDWDDLAIARKNALLNLDFDICDSEEEINFGEIAEGEERVQSKETTQSVETGSDIGEFPAVPVHTIQLNPAAGADFPHSGLGVVIPAEVAAEVSKGGFKLVLEPIQSALAGEPTRFSIKAVPLSPPTPLSPVCDGGSESNEPTLVSKEPASEGDTDINSTASDTEHDAPRSKQKSKGLALHTGGERLENTAFGLECPLRQM